VRAFAREGGKKNVNALVPGRPLGRYELLLPLAKGGMAQVWAARLRGTRGFQKIVAVKTILAETMEGTRAEQMFLEEATLAAHIHHPNVVATLELGEHEGTLYLVMEWVNGEPLSQIMLRAAGHGGTPLVIAVDLMRQTSKGLHAAHEARDEAGQLLGIVHRDVSPHNVLVSYDGTAKIVDFGIAKATARASSLTEDGELKGKFAYMAPEQISGRPLDRRADIFGLGVLLYTLTTGKHPFRGASAGETLQNICVNPPLVPSKCLAGYPRALEAVVLRALAKDPEERWPTAQALLSALEAAMPECLGSREAEVAAFMQRHFGARASERMTELRLAQQLADRTQPGTTSGSGSSLRAVSLDQLTAANQARDSVEIEVVNEGSLDVPVLAAPSRRRATRLLAAGGLVLGLSLLAFFVRRPPGSSVHATGVAAASELVLPRDTGVPGASAAAAPAPNGARSTLGAMPEDVTPASSGERSAADPVRARTNVVHAPRPRSLVQASVPAATGTSAVAAAPVAVAPAPEAGPKKLNAWNADNYGGRR
jgi:serine/threonine-protein kinase